MRSLVLAMLEMECPTIPRRTGRFKKMETSIFLRVVRVKRSPLLGEKLCVDDCGSQGSVPGERECVLSSAGGKGEKEKGSDGALVLSSNGVLVGLLASAVPAASQFVTDKTQLVNLFYFHEAGRWCTFEENKSTPFGIVVERRLSCLLIVLWGTERALRVSPWFSTLKDKFSALRFETCLSRAPRAKTTALQATVSSSRAF